jgi:hypothetical protein
MLIFPLRKISYLSKGDSALNLDGVGIADAIQSAIITPDVAEKDSGSRSKLHLMAEPKETAKVECVIKKPIHINSLLADLFQQGHSCPWIEWTLLQNLGRSCKLLATRLSKSRFKGLSHLVLWIQRSGSLGGRRGWNGIIGA